MQYLTQNLITFKKYIIENFGIHYPADIIRHIIALAIFDYLIIDVSDVEKLRDLFRYVYSTKQLSHVLYNGMPYYPYTTPWYFRLGQRPSYDPDIKCKYCLENFYILRNHLANSHRYQCTPIIYPHETATVEYIFDNYENDNVFDKNGLSMYDSQNIFLMGYNEMTICNGNLNRRYNHAGSDHCRIYLKYYDTIVINKWTTFKTFIDACYKIKKHKFDVYYESFDGTEIIKDGSDFCVRVLFKHQL